MSGKLLDTNAAIALQNADQDFLNWLDGKTDILLPAPVIGELYYGALNSSRTIANIAAIEKLVADNVILDCDVKTAENYGRVRHQLKLKGRPIPENDIWIAAVALQYDLTLVTRDQHFNEVDGLSVESW